MKLAGAPPMAGENMLSQLPSASLSFASLAETRHYQFRKPHFVGAGFQLAQNRLYCAQEAGLHPRPSGLTTYLLGNERQ